MLATDRKLPVSGGAEKRSYVRGMFHAIAPSYDFLNHLLSLNLDKRWRRKAVERPLRTMRAALINQRKIGDVRFVLLPKWKIVRLGFRKTREADEQNQN